MGEQFASLLQSARVMSLIGWQGLQMRGVAKPVLVAASLIATGMPVIQHRAMHQSCDWHSKAEPKMVGILASF